MNLPLMDIRIGIDPDLLEIGTFVLTWHGLLTFLAVATAVFLVGRWAKKDGMDTDAVYSVAVWGIIGGIIGARLLHVIDLWNEVYRHDPVQIFRVYEGGITIYGAILGGFLGGAGYLLVRNHPTFLRIWNSVLRLPKLERAPLPSVGRLADLVTPAMLLGMALGRVGDIINGEHFAKAASLPWSFIYTHPEVEALYNANSLNPLVASHPAVAYELLMDLAILAVILPLRNRIRPAGMFFTLYLATYSLGRFFISFLRLDKEWAIGLNEAQFVAIVVLIITVPVLLFKAQIVRQPTPARAPSPGARSKR